MATSDSKRLLPAGKNRNLVLRSDSLCASTQKVHRPRSQSPVHLDITGTLGKFAGKNNFRPVFASRRHARALATGLPRQDHLYNTTDESFRFHNNNSMKCLIHLIPLRIRVHSRNTQPHLNTSNFDILTSFGIVNMCSRRNLQKIALTYIGFPN